MREHVTLIAGTKKTAPSESRREFRRFKQLAILYSILSLAGSLLFQLVVMRPEVGIAVMAAILLCTGSITMFSAIRTVALSSLESHIGVKAGELLLPLGLILLLSCLLGLLFGPSSRRAEEFSDRCLQEGGYFDNNQKVCIKDGVVVGVFQLRSPK